MNYTFSMSNIFDIRQTRASRANSGIQRISSNISGQYLLNCGFWGQIIAKNNLNRPYLSSRHLRNRSQHFSYLSAISQYFLHEALRKVFKKLGGQITKFERENFGIWPPNFLKTYM